MKDERYRLVILRKRISTGCEIEYEGDSSSARVGIILPGTRTIRAAATPAQKEQVRAWRAIQCERLRLRLPQLAPEEMTIDP